MSKFLNNKIILKSIPLLILYCCCVQVVLSNINSTDNSFETFKESNDSISNSTSQFKNADCYFVNNQTNQVWKLVYEDQFNGDQLNETDWYIEQQNDVCLGMFLFCLKFSDNIFDFNFLNFNFFQVFITLEQLVVFVPTFSCVMAFWC